MCKYFNLSWLDIEYDLNLWEYIKLLSEAAYADEVEQYSLAQLQAVAFHNPKRIKKIKPAEMRFSGGSSDPSKSLLAFTASKIGANFQPNGKIEEFAKATSRTVVYSDPDNDGFLIGSEDGEAMIVIYPIDELTFINSITGQKIDRRVCIIVPLKNVRSDA